MPKRASWKEPEKHTIAPSARECARRIGMNPRTFADLAKGEVVKARADGRWDTRAVCAALAAHDAAQTTAEENPGKKTGEALERLRTANAQIAEIELAKLRGEVIERDAVHVAYGEVVAIVRAGLLAMPKWGAVNLANLSSDKIEVLLDRHVRRIADDFQTRCGEVRLVVPSVAPAAKDRRSGRRAGGAKE